MFLSFKKAIKKIKKVNNLFESIKKNININKNYRKT